MMEFNQEALDKLKPLAYWDIDILTPFQECESCGKKKEDVTFAPNPFAADVGDEIVWEFLCSDCYQESCNDI